MIIALLCLYFSGIPLVRSLGYTTAMVVATAVLAAITFLPAVLGLLGRRILKLPFRLGERKHAADHPGGWFRWAGAIRNHPLVAAVTGIVMLGLIALPALDLRLGAEDFGQLPKDTTERQAYDALAEGFGVGTNGPLLIAVNVTGQPLTPPPPQDAQSEEAQGVPPQVATTPAGDTRLVQLEQEIAKQNNVQSVSPAATDKNGTAAVFSVTPKTSPSAYATQDLVNHLRDKTIPDTTKGTGLTAYVGGTTASYIDLATKISDKLFLVIGIVVVLSFLLLTLAFRTVLVPLISALINLLAVAASTGVLTAVFEKGFASVADRRGPRDAGGELRAADDVRDPLRAVDGLPGVPGLADCRAPQGGADNSEAVRAGLVNAGRVIAAAATIMFAVFFSFVINGDPVVKQFGIGLAVLGRDRRARRAPDHARPAGADGRAELVPAALARSGAARSEGRGRPRDAGRDAHRPGLRLSHRKTSGSWPSPAGPSHLSSPSPGA